MWEDHRTSHNCFALMPFTVRDFTVPRALPLLANKCVFFFTNYPPIMMCNANLIDSHAFLQSAHGCKLNTVAWLVELSIYT